LKRSYARVFASLIAGCASLVILGCGGGSDEPPDVVTSTSLTCPSGQVATGISVRQGEIIDRLAVRCAERNESMILTSTSAERASVGGTGGILQDPFTCSEGKGITKIAGYNARSSWADMLASVRVTCATDELSPNFSSGSGDLAYSFQCDAINKVATGFQLNLVGRGGNYYAGFVTGITCVELYPLT
jgi:hypothetical protein